MCFLRLKKKNVERVFEQFAPQKLSTRAADLYIKHGHTTQGLKAISGRILVTYFREEEIKRFGNFGFIEARSRRERGIHARVHLRVKIYSLLSTANLSSVLSSR
jgi:hypothetical protein